MPHWFRPWAAVLLVAVVVAAGIVWIPRATRGPKVTVYEPVRRPVTETLLVTGRLAPPVEVALGPQIQSTAVDVLVEEGDVVEQGQLLARLADDEIQARMREAEARVSEAAARLERLRGVGQKLASEKVVQARLDLEQAEKAYQRVDEVYRSGLGSEATYDDARKARDAARSRLVAAQLEEAASGASGADRRAAAAALAQAQAALEVAQVQVDRTQLRAPRDGQILERRVDVGQVVRPGDALFRFAGDDELQVRIAPDEYHLGDLEVGQLALVSTEAFPDRPLRARVARIAPQVDPGRGTIEVRLELTDEANLPLRPEMSANVEVILGEEEDALVLPTWLVRDLGSQAPWVLVATEGQATRRSVRLGLQGSDAVQVLEGLEAHDLVVGPEDDVAPGDAVRTRSVEAALPAEG